MSLKKMFGITERHSLVNTGYKEKVTPAHYSHWTFEERDEEGLLLSKIEYWDCTNPDSLTTKIGFRKTDPAGKLIVEKSL